MENIENELKGLLERAGFGVVVGKDGVIEKMIDLAPIEGAMKLCSGYGVHPDGEKCSGCKDCRKI